MINVCLKLMIFYLDKTFFTIYFKINKKKNVNKNILIIFIIITFVFCDLLSC